MKVQCLLVLWSIVCLELVASTSTPCPNPVNCLVDPCAHTTCQSADARCISNYCGGCNAACMVCPSSGSCMGLSNCENNNECESNELCCSTGSTGCCMVGVAIILPTSAIPPTQTITTPTDCSTIGCPFLLCIDGASPVTPPGQCCPQCPPTTESTAQPTTPPNCDVVHCANPPRCVDGTSPVIPPGQCCSQCPPTTESTAQPTPTNCDPDRCPAVLCLYGNPIIPPGQCCPQCPPTTESTAQPTTPPNCDVVRCANPLRCVDGTSPVIPPGQCCSQCPPITESTVQPTTPPNCDRVRCPEILCIDGASLDIPPGECCPQCSPTPIRPDPMHALVCPSRSNPSTCSPSCSDDQKCCDNTCMLPDRIPYYSVPLKCPSTRTSGLTGTCNTTRQSQCTDTSVCASNQLCCRNACGRYCMDAVPSNQPCLAVRDLFPSNNEVGGIPGAYVPSCQSDGTFTPLQRHGSTGYSWCVNVITGYPISSFYPRGANISCPACIATSTIRYSVGETFPDDCNTCVCGDSGNIACTRRGCISPCSLRPLPGPCRASITAFYYDQNSMTCHQFTYGGCSGNANKFANVRDCLTMCDPAGACLQPKVAGPCEALQPSFFFNSSSGMCERFNYGGCNGNDNRFSTEKECLGACSPDTPPNRCLNIQCEIPNCRPGTRAVMDDQHCCPYCPDECRADQFTCSNGLCISRDDVCDSLTDCPNGEDEFRCPQSCGHKCGDGDCIDRDHVCDVILDCTDHSDMQNCSRGLTGVVYIQEDDIPQQCPNSSNILSVCGSGCNDECGSRELCCNTGCGRSCIQSIPVTPICRSISRRSRGLIGAFQPSCEEDDSFSELQCHGSTGYCWCVDVEFGQPVTNGTRSRPSCPRCTKSDVSYPIGATFSSDDGCNTCKCTMEYEIVCTRKACITQSCDLKGQTILHNQTYQDECSSCTCLSGRLNCRGKCSDDDDEESVNIAMRFNGDFHLLTPDGKAEFIREVKRIFVNYEESLNFNQEQISNIDLKEEELDVIVTVALEPTYTSASQSGANLTLLLSQLTYDYMTGSVVIRFDGSVFEPEGTLQVVEPQTDSASGSILLYILVPVGVVIVVAALLVIVVIVVAGTRKTAPPNYLIKQEENNCDASFKKDGDVTIN